MVSTPWVLVGRCWDGQLVRASSPPPGPFVHLLRFTMQWGVIKCCRYIVSHLRSCRHVLQQRFEELGKLPRGHGWRIPSWSPMVHVHDDVSPPGFIYLYYSHHTI